MNAIRASVSIETMRNVDVIEYRGKLGEKQVLLSVSGNDCSLEVFIEPVIAIRLAELLTEKAKRVKAPASPVSRTSA